MRAKDLMVPARDFVRPDDTLKTAVALLRTVREGEDCVGIKGLPVLDVTGKLVGIVAMGDFIKTAFPFYMGMMDLSEFSWDGMVETLAKKTGDKLVKDIMSKVVITVNEDSPLMEVVDHMIKHLVKRMPVLNKEGKVVGMLYERDVFFAVTRAMLEEGSGIE
jgi:CBS domain-containing protein